MHLTLAQTDGNPRHFQTRRYDFQSLFARRRCRRHDGRKRHAADAQSEAAVARVASDIALRRVSVFGPVAADGAIASHVQF